MIMILILFFIGKYIDEVLCDVIRIHASYILLGRPCQFNRKITYDGARNRYTMMIKPLLLYLLHPNKCMMIK